MSKVRPKPIKDYFRQKNAEDIKQEYKKAVLFSARKVINPVSFLTTLTALSLFAGLFDHRLLYLVVLIPLSMFVLYRRTLKIAKRITLSRIIPDQASRNQEIEIKVRAVNGSRSTIRDFVVRDRFNGCKTPQAVLCIPTPVKSARPWEGSYKKVCNAGMGEFFFDELELTFTDPMGIFEFTLSAELTDAILIFPVPVAIPQLPISPVTFLESFTHGLYESPRKGTFANFVGIREYVRGDSMRHVSWKSTAKTGKLMVKEFESVCNTDVSLFLDMNIDRHCGTENLGSWETGKDTALALLAQQLENGNRVQFFSQDIHVNLGGGPEHSATISRQVFKLRPLKDPSPEELPIRYQAAVPDGTVAVFIRPIFPMEASRAEETQALIQSINRFRARGIQCFCILIDSGSYLRMESIPGISESTNRQIQDSAHVIQVIRDELTLAGIQTFVLRLGRNLGDALLGTREST